MLEFVQHHESVKATVKAWTDPEATTTEAREKVHSRVTLRHGKSSITLTGNEVRQLAEVVEQAEANAEPEI